MASTDLSYIRHRQGELRRAVRRSSPVLVYSGTIGIIVVAIDKNPVYHRVGQILDRMACVSRGEFVASQLVHRIAAHEAYGMVGMLKSRGEEVLISDAAVQKVSTLLARQYNNPLGDTLPVETTIVQLRESPASDYMAHIGIDGSTQLFDRVRYLGSLGDSEEPQRADEKLGKLEQFNASLRERWTDLENISALIEWLGEFPEAAPLLSTEHRRDVVLLNRERFLAGDYEDIFERLTL